MSDNLSHNLEKLKSTFNNILLLRNDVTKTKNIVNSKIVQLKTVFGELSKSTTKKTLLFSLDSFFFQYKLFSVELESIDKFRILLNNRMYCDYYKLYLLIINYIKDHADELLEESLEFRAFPVYKDLEPFQEYNLEDIRNIHSDIMKYIHYLYRCYEVNHEMILNYNKKTRIGFSISNLLNTLEHDNTKLKQQMMLYINYLSFFHISQTKHLKKLLNRLKEFDEEIEENVSGNHIYSVDDVEYTDSFRKYEDESTPAVILIDIQPTISETTELGDNNESSSMNITLTPDTSNDDNPLAI
jgi:hypothetical protein